MRRAPWRPLPALDPPWRRPRSARDAATAPRALRPGWSPGPGLRWTCPHPATSSSLGREGLRPSRTFQRPRDRMPPVRTSVRRCANLADPEPVSDGFQERRGRRGPGGARSHGAPEVGAPVQGVQASACRSVPRLVRENRPGAGRADPDPRTCVGSSDPPHSSLVHRSRRTAPHPRDPRTRPRRHPPPGGRTAAPQVRWLSQEPPDPGRHGGSTEDHGPRSRPARCPTGSGYEAGAC
jgi:hypothetical protein